ncbi:MAG TPA: hypothetical protein PK530_02270 [Anaerolineales bacterium]|nr:hypothetical protein [Anaerolineales bacterium]
MISDQMKQLIMSSVAEVDPQQIKITRQLTHAQRVQQGLSMIRLAEQVAVYRLRKRKPMLSKAQAKSMIRERQGNYG